ncbi:MAG: cytochrome C [Desulfuromonas sp.]|nr:cytochrome C [Desulfuromonas sp.]
MLRMFTLIIVVLFIGTGRALAVPPGKSIEFKYSPMGTVKFDGDVHKKAAASCKECHNDGMFPKMKQGTVKISMEQIYAGKLCGFCHNGKKAFEAKANCQRCHTPPKK